jgi:hypothetical protein
MNKVDFKILNITDDGSVEFGIANLGGLNVGTQKTINMWLKFFYNEDCGGIIKFIREHKLTNKNSDAYSMFIAMAVQTSNDKITKMQEGKTLEDDERFRNCAIKSLDIQHRMGLININLEFSTYESIVSLKI